MRNYIIAFIAVLTFTCLFGGRGLSRDFRPVAVRDCIVDERVQLKSRNEAGMLPEMNFVDTDRDYLGAASVKDTKT
ncbi:MAG: hypothetical protein IPM23_04895 [Candidatus Melainabacteria bacterium]|nr:hypothetical protein [Candidatus Melainabacteria bacterium]